MNYKIRQIFINNKSDAFNEFIKIGATPPGAEIMSEKIINIAIKVDDIDNRAANILKQEMLVRNGDVVTSREALYSSGSKSDVIIFGTKKNIRSMVEKIKLQPFGLKNLSLELEEFLNKLEKDEANNILRIAKKEFNIKKQTVIMGIVNVTPDSFFDGGEYFKLEDAYKRVDKIVGEGADIIDVGGMSTRPGSKPVSLEDELERTIPVVRYIKKNYDISVSIDTYRSQVASEAIQAGAEIVNDISGLNFDKDLKKIIADSGSYLVLMHMQGNPQNMQENPSYKDVTGEIYNFFNNQILLALEAGIKSENIIIDPGLGFGKTLEHNFIIIKKLADFKSLGYPILIGASRKSFTGALLNLPPNERLESSLAAATICVLNGASILRVHDVKETIKAISLVKAIQNV
ncbi:MAG: dihydropteroate synthase [Actinobacteria bacterium]|nr:dihydropteroate synthase [Cyanobacteriota bacterium]MCL5771615.1 dihydropteroate synthase [Actinomycetota bacterium]